MYGGETKQTLITPLNDNDNEALETGQRYGYDISQTAYLIAYPN